MAHQHRGLADADGYALPGFATGADAVVECGVVADRFHAGKDVRSVANQGGAFDRVGDFTVFNHVTFGNRKHEFAGGYIHLAASQGFGVKAASDA